MRELVNYAKAIQDEVVANRRLLHQHAEVGYDLPVTTEIVTNKLKAMGYEPEELYPGGVVATVGNGQGKTVLLRADMDALPIGEEADVPFRSITSNAHACGHDMHMAMLLGAAKLLKAREQEIAGTVKLMFQPDEEGISGAKAMIDAGVMINPVVDHAVALHIMAQYPSGKLFYKKGTCSASSDGFTITIIGRGGHGAIPHQTIDPIHISAHLYLALQSLISRECNPNESALITIGAIEGGTVGNIIPDVVTMKGTIRTYNQSVRDQLVNRVKVVVEQIVSTFGGTGKVEFLRSAPSMYSDLHLMDQLISPLQELIGEEELVESDIGLTGSEDFAYITQLVPSVFFILGGGTIEEGYLYGQHHPKIVFNEEAMVNGVVAYTACALTLAK